MRAFVGTEEEVKQKIFSGEYKACDSCLVVFSSGTGLVVAELDPVDDEYCVECLLKRSSYICSNCAKGTKEVTHGQSTAVDGCSRTEDRP